MMVKVFKTFILLLNIVSASRFFRGATSSEETEAAHPRLEISYGEEESGFTHLSQTTFDPLQPKESGDQRRRDQLIFHGSCNMCGTVDSFVPESNFEEAIVSIPSIGLLLLCGDAFLGGKAGLLAPDLCAGVKAIGATGKCGCGTITPTPTNVPSSKSPAPSATLSSTPTPLSNDDTLPPSPIPANAPSSSPLESTFPTLSPTPQGSESADVLDCSIDEIYLIERLHQGSFTLPDWTENVPADAAAIWPFKTYDGKGIATFISVQQSPPGGVSYLEPQKINVTFSADNGKSSCAIQIDLIDDDARAASLLDSEIADLNITAADDDDALEIAEYTASMEVDSYSCDDTIVAVRIMLISSDDFLTIDIMSNYIYLWVFEKGSTFSINKDLIRVSSSNLVNNTWVLEFAAPFTAPCPVSGAVKLTGGGASQNGTDFNFVARSSSLPSNRARTTILPDDRSLQSFPTLAPSPSPSVAPSFECGYCRVKYECPNATATSTSTATNYQSCSNGYRYGHLSASGTTVSGTAASTCSDSDSTASAEISGDGASVCRIWMEGEDCCKDQFEVSCEVEMGVIGTIAAGAGTTIDDDYMSWTSETENPCFGGRSLGLTVDQESITGRRRRLLENTTEITSETFTIGGETYTLEGIYKQRFFVRRDNTTVVLRRSQGFKTDKFKFKSIGDKTIFLKHFFNYEGRLEAPPKSTPTHGKLALYSGSVRVKVHNLKDKVFTIKTPAAVTGVRG